MSKIIAKLQSPIDKVSGHIYTGFTIKSPFINFSFAPTIFTAPNGAVFLLALFRQNRGGREKVLPPPEPAPESLVTSGFSRAKC